MGLMQSLNLNLLTPNILAPTSSRFAEEQIVEDTEETSSPEVTACLNLCIVCSTLFATKGTL